jgi:hypothetical protein
MSDTPQTLNKKALRSFETSDQANSSAQCNIPVEQNYQHERRTNLKPRTETEQLMMQPINIRAMLYVSNVKDTITTLN